MFYARCKAVGERSLYAPPSYSSHLLLLGLLGRMILIFDARQEERRRQAANEGQLCKSCVQPPRARISHARLGLLGLRGARESESKLGRLHGFIAGKLYRTGMLQVPGGRFHAWAGGGQSGKASLVWNRAPSKHPPHAHDAIWQCVQCAYTPPGLRRHEAERGSMAADGL